MHAACTALHRQLSDTAQGSAGNGITTNYEGNTRTAAQLTIVLHVLA
jgi:hypothetical protein